MIPILPQDTGNFQKILKKSRIIELLDSQRKIGCFADHVFDKPHLRTWSYQRNGEDAWVIYSKSLLL